MPTCSSCGHSWSSRSRVLPTHPGPDASDTKLRAYYKATAPRDDIAFVLRLRPDLAIVMPDRPTRADARRVFDRARVDPNRPQPDERAFWSAIRRYTRARLVTLRLTNTAKQAERLLRLERQTAGTWPPVGVKLF